MVRGCNTTQIISTKFTHFVNIVLGICFAGRILFERFSKGFPIPSHIINSSSKGNTKKYNGQFHQEYNPTTTQSKFPLNNSFNIQLLVPTQSKNFRYYISTLYFGPYTKPTSLFVSFSDLCSKLHFLYVYLYCLHYMLSKKVWRNLLLEKKTVHAFAAISWNHICLESIPNLTRLRMESLEKRLYTVQLCREGNSWKICSTLCAPKSSTLCDR